MLEPLYTAQEMRTAEEGHDVGELMARAGRAVAEEALRRYPDAQSFSAVCGKGANGGDARIALDVLRSAGRKAGEGLEGDVIIDGLFGTGFRGEPRPEAAAQIHGMNERGAPIVAVDLPSGVNADTGEVEGVAVRAELTVAMHGRKVGNVVAPGRFHCGEVVVADIGLDPGETEHRLVTREILSLIPPKRVEDNKYTAGHVLVVGGAPGMSGAASLTANAALRADCGYVTICAPAPSLPVLETLERRASTVLTPHAGELGRLLDEDSDWVSAHRLEAVRRGSERFGCVCLLKGADTLVAAPGRGVVVAAHGPPSLAAAGTGDVLTGVTAAFLAKGIEAPLAAAAAATACGLAAWLRPARGLVAGDVIGALPEVLDAEI